MAESSIDRRKLGGIFALVGGLAIILGLVLPWLSINGGRLFGYGISRTGMDMTEGEGMIMFIAGVVAGIIALMVLVADAPVNILLWVLGVVGLVVGYVTVGDILELNDRLENVTQEQSINASMGPGGYITLLGAGLVLVSAFALFGSVPRRSKRDATAEPPPTHVEEPPVTPAR